MKKQILLILSALIMSYASFAFPITGPSSGCVGSSYHFMDSLYTYYGTWITTDPSVATIDSSGYLSAIATGSTTIIFIYGTDTETVSFSVDSAISPIVESGTSLCVGATLSATDATPGGTWSTSNPYIASVSATGVVTGVNTGAAFIYYTTASGTCNTYVLNTVISSSPGFIFTPSDICTGSTTALIADSLVAGGTWSTSDAAVATVDGSGDVTGISSGTATISYTATTSCGTGYATTPVTISTSTDPGTISGSSSVNVGSSITLSDYTASAAGIWSSSDPSIAIITSTGIVTGIAAGTATISYSVDGCGGTLVATHSVTVDAVNGISGYVVFDSSYYCLGNVKVWLITYDPTTLDLEAIDSVTEPIGGSTSVLYQFTGMSTDSFRIKAAVDSIGCGGATGYVPTYHTSSLYWSSADVVYHTSGTYDSYKNISMITGTPTSGPGFVGGSVTMGADRGTSEGIPAVGVLIFALDATTHALVQQTTTDAMGNYSFSSLPVGSYEIYPELINYATTPYTSVSVTSGSTTVNNADFEEHTVSRTITPRSTESVSNIGAVVSSVFAYPNPTSGKLNIQWVEPQTEKGTVIVTDITGRELSKTSVNMTQGSGAHEMDLSGFTDGTYMITVRSASINYNGKIQVQH